MVIPVQKIVSFFDSEKEQEQRPKRRLLNPFKIFNMIPNSVVPMDVKVCVVKLGDSKKADKLIRESQKLRFIEFFGPGTGGNPSAEMLETGIEEDKYDKHCDHIIVQSRGRVVASSRVYRWSVAKEHDGLYTAGEFDLDETIANVEKLGKDTAELGRTCIAGEFQGSFILVKALFGEVGRYCEKHNVGALIGCASVHGTNPEELADLFTALGDKYMAPEGFRPKAIAPKTPIMLKDPEAVDKKAVAECLPPLLKFYTRILQGYVGPEAFIDEQFNCIDLFTLVVLDDVDSTQKRFFMR